MILTKKPFIFIFCIAVLSIWVLAQSEASNTRNQIKRIIVEEARNSIVPPALALALAKVESNFSAHALSSAGARGVMQIMPSTGRNVFGVHEDELWNPRLNIQLGIDYLAQLYHQYGRRWDLALSHYNGGTLRGYGRHAKAHSYTRKYVKSVLNWRNRYNDQSSIWLASHLKDNTIKSDGWEPARTRTEVALKNSLRKYERMVSSRDLTKSRTKKPKRPHQIAKIRPKSNCFANTHLASWSNRSRNFRGFDEEFFKRVQRTRETMSDFGPRTKNCIG